MGCDTFRWEIADIGILVFLRLVGQSRTNKMAVLQSKRLYPVGAPVLEEMRVDFEIGLARLADPEELERDASLWANGSLQR